MVIIVLFASSLKIKRLQVVPDREGHFTGTGTRDREKPNLPGPGTGPGVTENVIFPVPVYRTPGPGISG